MPHRSHVQGKAGTEGKKDLKGKDVVTCGIDFRKL